MNIIGIGMLLMFITIIGLMIICQKLEIENRFLKRILKKYEKELKI